MKVKFCVTTILFLMIVLNIVNAQSNIQKNIPSKYIEAEQFANMANIELQKGEVKLADSLIKQSILIYPTKNVYDYIRSLFKLSDEVNGNAIIDLLLNAVNNFKGKNIYIKEPIASKYVDGKMVAEIKEYELTRAQLLFGYEAFLVNKEFGNFERMVKILEPLVKLDIENKKSKNKYLAFDFEYEILQELKWQLPLSKDEYDLAIKIIESNPTTTLFNADRKNQTLAYIYMEKGDYPKALAYCEKYTVLLGKNVLLFMINAMMGKNEAAISNYEVFIANNAGFTPNNIFYYLAIIDLNKKNYSAALSNLDSALNHRVAGMGNLASAVLNDKWKVYKSIGDAYLGLEQYEKARDAYNIALLSNQKYGPAVTAMNNLESIMANAKTKDKIAPIITLLEPTAKRGLKITTATEKTLIKGFASDLSGIKEVSINEKLIYSQTGGDFWGEIALKSGTNTITITATDLLGNKSVQNFEIEKLIPTNNSTQNNEAIVPIIEKPGKNYCLLVGAQNYEDSNIPSLSNPISDAIKLKLILKNNYNFPEENIITLFNPHNNDIIRQLLELTNKINPQDNLVIFYAGHGIWVEKEKKGYWLMTNAKREDVNTWLPNKQILDLLAKIPARHTLLITDACFSGSVFKTRGIAGTASKQIQELDEKISRVAITSGNDTEVPDESVFMKYLIKALSENKEKYLTAQKMFITKIIEAVMTETKTEPRYGTLELAGHIGGDFIFSKN